MGITEDIADKLARETLEVLAETGDDAIIKQVADAIGGSSQTMEEAFLTAVRIRRAEGRAHAVLARFRSDSGAAGDD